VILHPGRAESWWHGPRGLARFDGAAFWADDVRIPFECLPHVTATDVGWVANSAEQSIRIRSGDVEKSGRHRYGERLTMTRTHIWSIGDFDLPIGARESPHLTPFPTGLGVVWADDGFVYRLTDRARPVAAGNTFEVGPHGAIRLGNRVAPPVGSARQIPDLAGPIRWRSDGGALRGMRGEVAVQVDLLTGEVSNQTGVIPVSFDADLHVESGEIRRGSQVLQWGVIEASCALSGPYLAGPGGVVWDLRHGQPLFRKARIFLGATAPVPGGFATVHWETGRGHMVSFDGKILAEISLPLEEGDVISGVGVGGVFQSAEGHTWGLDGQPAARTEPIIDPGQIEISGRVYTWDESGELAVTAPSAQSPTISA